MKVIREESIRIGGGDDPAGLLPLPSGYHFGRDLEELEEEQDDVIERIQHFQRRARELKRLIRDAKQARRAASDSQPRGRRYPPDLVPR